MDQPPGQPIAGAPKHRRWRGPLLLAIAVSVLVVASPWAGSMVGARWTGSPLDGDISLSATLIAIGVVALGWGITVVYRLALRQPVGRASPSTGVVPVEDPSLAAALLAVHDVPCARCGYSLRGLASGACPECHEPVRLLVGSRLGAGPSRRLVGAAALVCLLRGGAGGAYIWYFIEVVWARIGGFPGGTTGFPLWRFWPVLVMPGIYVVALPAMAVAGCQGLRAGRAADRERARWRLLWIALVAMTADSVVYVVQMVFTMWR